MPKKSISSLELAALVNELQFLTRGKLSQLYHLDQEFIFQLHAQGKGKQLLKIIPGKWLCLTKRKETVLKPSSFCMQLRKYLANATINQIYQKDSERIAVFELEKKEKFFLIIELFSKGNLVLTDDKLKIITALERQVWKDRTVKPGEKYLFPSQDVSWRTVTEKELAKVLQQSDKKNLAITLATEIGLGGVYAEEVCRRAEVDKSLKPAAGDAKKIIKAIKEMIKLIVKPAGLIYDEDVNPFLLQNKKPKKKLSTYNEAIDSLNPFLKTSPYEKKIAAVKRMIEEQEGLVENLQKKIDMNKKKGELIYEKYSPLQKLLEIVKEMRKSKDWSEISKELKKEKRIKGVDLKRKKIVVDL